MSQTETLKTTEEQAARIPEFREKWTEIGRRVGPVNRQEAEKDAAAAYQVENLNPPFGFIWFDSPLSGHRAFSLISVVCEQIENNDVKPNRKRKYSEIFEPVWDLIVKQITPFAEKDEELQAMVDFKFGNIDLEAVRQKPITGCGYGQSDSAWLSFYNFFDEVCGLESCKALRPLFKLAENCGWWWPFDKVAILTERPTELHLEEDRLHKRGGPAVAYSDGFAVYALNGTRIPEEWGKIQPEQWDPKWLLSEDNAELKRILLREIGYDRTMAALKSEIVHMEGDMELHKITDNVDVEDIHLLKVTCPSTGAFYTLRVPPKIADCEEARRWTMWQDEEAGEGGKFNIINET